MQCKVCSETESTKFYSTNKSKKVNYIMNNSITFFRTRFLTRIIYKNGVSVDMWFYKFDFNRDWEKTRVEWEGVGYNRPILINPTEIMAIYQMKTRINIFSFFKSFFKRLVVKSPK